MLFFCGNPRKRLVRRHPTAFFRLLYPLKKYYAANSDQDDLISIGTIGLIKAVNTFDPDKNIKLSSYAARCIENAILSQRNKWRLRWKTMNLLGQNGLCFAA